MKSFWDEFPRIWHRVRRAGTTCLFLDFDGTLAAIAPTPEQAVLADSTRAFLVQLSKRSDTVVAVVSGRPLRELKARVGVEGIVYAGDHGWAWEVAGRVTRKAVPAKTRAALRRAARVSARVITDYPGAGVEEKYASIAVHYRQVSRGRQREFVRMLNRALMPIVAAGTLARIPGKKVVEVRPSLRWGKGEAVTLLTRFLTRGRPGLYESLAIGDDRTDEHIFAAHPEWITVRVGRRRNSGAAYVVRDTRGVARILAWLADRPYGIVQTDGDVV